MRPDSGAIVNAAGTRTTYTWDMADRLTGIALSGGGLITMLYSATGLRRVRQDGSGTVKYLWDGQSPLMETDGDGTTTARYTGATDPYGPVVSQRRGNTSRFFHPNDLGTFDKVTDADAATTDTYILDAWGVQHAATGSTVNPFRYIGALGYYTEPDLGLHYVRARWLRPATGSWLSVDPVEGQQRYGYVGGRATAGGDASGLGCVEDYYRCLKAAELEVWRCVGDFVKSPPPFALGVAFALACPLAATAGLAPAWVACGGAIIGELIISWKTVETCTDYREELERSCENGFRWCKRFWGDRP